MPMMQRKQPHDKPKKRIVFRVQADNMTLEGAVVDYLNKYAAGNHVVSAQEKARAALKAFLLPEACYMQGLPELEIKRRAKEVINLLHRQALEIQAEYLPETMEMPRFNWPVGQPLSHRGANGSNTELFMQDQSSNELSIHSQNPPDSQLPSSQETGNKDSEIDREAVQKFLGTRIGAYSQISF